MSSLAWCACCMHLCGSTQPQSIGPCSRIQTQHNKPYHTTSKRNSNGDDGKLHRSCEIGARNVDMNLDVDALLGVRLMIAREVDDSDDGLPQVSAWRGGGSRRDIVQEFKGDALKNGRATTVERKHRDEEVEDVGGGDGPLVVRREKRQLVA